MPAKLRTYRWESESGGRPVAFRFLQSEDKELFKNFIRSLSNRDNFYLLLDVNNDLGIDHWMSRVESGHTLSVIALENDQMIGYCNLHMNEPPWIRHVAEIRMSVASAHRGRGLGTTLANEIFAIAQSRGLEKIWARMAGSQESAQRVFQSLGFRTEALLSDFVKNENGLTEDLVIMSYDAGKRCGS